MYLDAVRYCVHPIPVEIRLRLQVSRHGIHVTFLCISLKLRLSGWNNDCCLEGGKGAAIGCSLGGILLIGAGGFILRKLRMKRRIEADEDSRSQSEKGA